MGGTKIADPEPKPDADTPTESTAGKAELRSRSEINRGIVLAGVVGAGKDGPAVGFRAARTGPREVEGCRAFQT